MAIDCLLVVVVAFVDPLSLSLGLLLLAQLDVAPVERLLFDLATQVRLPLLERAQFLAKQADLLQVERVQLEQRRTSVAKRLDAQRLSVGEVTISEWSRIGHSLLGVLFGLSHDSAINASSGMCHPGRCDRAS